MMDKEHINRMAVDAGFNLDPDTGLILDTAGVYSVDDAVHLLTQAVARECEALVMQAAKDNPVMGASACYGAARDIRARFGLGE